MDEERDRLEVERQQACRRLENLTFDFNMMVAASRDTNADDEHDPEGATIAFERSQIGALIRQVQQHLDEVEVALTRLDAGEYRTCERCAEPIAEGRLEARPVARTCIACARMDQRYTESSS